MVVAVYSCRSRTLPFHCDGLSETQSILDTAVYRTRSGILQEWVRLGLGPRRRARGLAYLMSAADGHVHTPSTALVDPESSRVLGLLHG